MEFFMFFEVLKILIFFQSLIKKNGVITLILGKFKILNANMWAIYSKRFDFMVYTFICAFKKLNFSGFRGPQNLLGPSKKTQLLES